jgi:glycosyltransferase involved in cell wall biosynthesis
MHIILINTKNKNMSDFCILIPTINRADLLLEALSEYDKCYPNTRIIVVDTGKQSLGSSNPNVTIFGIPEPMCVARVLNCLISIAGGYYKEQNFLILNDDIILKKSEREINRMIKKGDENTFQVCTSEYNWSSFLLRKSVYDNIGLFDEEFEKISFEDKDYNHRMKLSGVKIKYEDVLNPDIYRDAMTIEKDPSFNNYDFNKELYIKKWGGIPGEEKYENPYNKESDYLTIVE